MSNESDELGGGPNGGQKIKAADQLAGNDKHVMLDQSRVNELLLPITRYAFDIHIGQVDGRNELSLWPVRET